jgi:hypothetical protein
MRVILSNPIGFFLANLLEPDITVPFGEFRVGIHEYVAHGAGKFS